MLCYVILYYSILQSIIVHYSRLYHVAISYNSRLCLYIFPGAGSFSPSPPMAPLGGDWELEAGGLVALERLVL